MVDDVFASFWDHAFVLFGINVALWVVTLVIGKAWPVDFIWSGWPPMLALHLFYEGRASGTLGIDDWNGPAGMTVILVWIWGLRLTVNFLARGGVGHEDWRYTDQRKEFGSYYWLVSLITVFLAQSTFMCTGTISLYPAILEPSDWTAMKFCGAVLTACAIVLEAVSDMQIDAFLLDTLMKSKKDGNDAAGASNTLKPVCKVGLWGWSRHPNYCGEFSFWLGLWFLAGGEVFSYQSIGPVVILALFLGVSIGLMETRQLKRRGEAYKQYQKEVPSSMFLLPPFFFK